MAEHNFTGRTDDHLYRPAMVYMMASAENGTFYCGVTTNGPRRIHEHREGLIPGFTKRYKVRLLVWYEFHQTITTAIKREKTIKGWPRKWKLALINKMNPKWKDLYGDRM